MAQREPGVSAVKRAEIASIYAAAADTINTQLAEAIRELGRTGSASAAFRAARAAQLVESIDGVVKRARVRGVRAVSSGVEEAFKAGSRLAVEQAKEIGIGPGQSDGGLGTSFAAVQEQTVERIAEDSAAKMAGRAGEHGRNAAGLFRTLSQSLASADREGRTLGRTFALSEREVNRVIADGVISGDPRRAMGLMRELIGTGAGLDRSVIEDYRRVGQQIISVGEWSGTVRTYAEMVVRTRTAEAQREGQIERQAALGIDLAQITGSNSANFCTRFVGLVVVVRGPARDGYMALADLPGGGPPFHPNCTKNLSAFVETLVGEGRKQAAALAAERYARAAASGTLLEPVRDGPRRGTRAA